MRRERFAFKAGEVDDDVETFRRCYEQVVQLQRGREQTAVGSDLLKWRHVEGLVQDLACHVGVKKTQMIKARVGAVKDAEAVSPRLDLEKRHDPAVDAVHVPVELLNPDRVLFGAVDNLGIVERAVVVEEAILQHERNLELRKDKLVDRKSGSKLKAATAGDTYVNGIKGPDGVGRGGLMRVGRGQLTAQAVPMTSLANLLSQQLHRTVVDKTLQESTTWS
jgi:hypothetical protein